MTDPAAQLAFLRAQRAAATDPAARAMFDTLIASLEAQQPKYQRQDAPPPARSHSQQIGGYASIQAAIAGDVYGDIYLVGERTESTKVLLKGYLRWMASQCGQLPLRGVREQRAAADVLDIPLDQVYTQLATTAQVERERLVTAADRAALDPATFQQAHTGAHLLPRELRTAMWCYDDAEAAMFAHTPLGLPAQAGTGAEFERLSLNDLRNNLQRWARVSFYGPQLVSEAIAASPRLVLLGEPGSGKSTALRFLALTLARAGLDETIDLAALLEGWGLLGTSGRLIPLFMPLLPLAQHLATQKNHNGSAADLWQAIDAHLGRNGATGEVITAMRAELVRGHVLLLLDGLDEVAGADSRRQVIDAVRAFAAEQPQCRMVVACRVRAYEGAQNSAWQLPGWPAATLADWTRGQMEQFVAAWYAAVVAAGGLAEQRRTERVQSLQRAISAREDLQRLGVRPLLLTIMALVHLNDGRLPEDRVSLYSRSVDILLAQWEQRGKDASEFGSLMDYVGLPNSGSTALRPLLARAAFAAHEAAKPGEVGRLSRPVLRTMVDDELKRLGHPNPSHGADRFLEYTDLRAGLIQSNDVGDEYAFPHQTFQEYLGGLALISGAQFVDEIMRRRHDDRWRVPIFLGLGHAVSEGLFAQSYQVLSRLLHARGRDQARRQRDLIFAYELADDVGWDRLERAGAEFSALHEALARELADVVEGTALPAAERVQAGIYLGRLGDPRPGVCSLPPAMVTFEAGDFGIGITRAEYHAIVKQEKRSDLEQEAREWYKDSINSAATRVARFALARYPVTNAQYALFIADDGYNTERRWWDAAGRAWLQQATQTEPRFWEDERFGSTCPNHPVVGVAWYEAMAFCRWLTLHLHDGFVYTLPSEAEWEYAARGAARRVYPWGDAAPGAERANFSGAHNGTTPVGSFSAGATPERLLDMAGNAWEWTRSVYRPYPYDPQDGRESLDSPASKYFTLRGGSWYDRSINLRAALRNNNTPDDQISLIGFRLARHLPV